MTDSLQNFVQGMCAQTIHMTWWLPYACAGNSCFDHLDDLVASIRGVRRSPLAAAIASVRKGQGLQQERRQGSSSGSTAGRPSQTGSVGSASWHARSHWLRDSLIVIMDPEGPSASQASCFGGTGVRGSPSCPLPCASPRSLSISSLCSLSVLLLFCFSLSCSLLSLFSRRRSARPSLPSSLPVTPFVVAPPPLSLPLSLFSSLHVH